MSEKKIRAVFFDAGNTLLYLDYSFIAEQASVAGTPVAADALRTSEYDARRAVDEYLAGSDIEDEKVWDIYFSTMFRGAGIRNDSTIEYIKERLRVANDFHGLWSHVPDESFETLRRLKEEGFKIGIISNADGRLHRVLKETGLDRLLNFAIDSRIVGYEKPDPRIFRLALEYAGEPADACIHVGDIVAADVEGARAVGIRPVLLDPTGRHNPDCKVINSLSEIIGYVDQLNG